MIETYKLIKELYDPEVAPKLELLKTREHRRLRGHDLKLFKVRANKNIRQQAFPSRVTNPKGSSGGTNTEHIQKEAGQSMEESRNFIQL